MHKATRRARKRGQFVEKVYRSKVFRRDAGICGICHEAVDPLNWHLDHIQPLARGGEHSYANTQVAHPACNQRKSASWEPVKPLLAAA
jgi:5-methylcytosine-specific restriction endonuclease McrA